MLWARSEIFLSVALGRGTKSGGRSIVTMIASALSPLKLTTMIGPSAAAVRRVWNFVGRRNELNPSTARILSMT